MFENGGSVAAETCAASAVIGARATPRREPRARRAPRRAPSRHALV